MKKDNKATRLLCFCPHWGNTLPFDRFCRKVRKAGYDGVEMDLPLERDRRDPLLQTLKDNGLLLIGQYWQSLEPAFRDNRKNYRRHLENLAEAQPLLINTQTGKDHFTLAQNLTLVRDAAAVSQASGIPVCHETHRGKFLYNIPVCVEAIREEPSMRLTLDASHWCTVHESLLHDQEAGLQRAIRATGHLHARVGHEEGPQVNDPRAPEWKAHVDRHFEWWDAVVARHAGRTLTVTTEFGPAPYMPAAPRTLRPLADQWAVNTHMLSLFRQRYA
jgi:sugar phosphate isomerase/epimerase